MPRKPAYPVDLDVVAYLERFDRALAAVVTATEDLHALAFHADHVDRERLFVDLTQEPHVGIVDLHDEGDPKHDWHKKAILDEVRQALRSQGIDDVSAVDLHDVERKVDEVLCEARQIDVEHLHNVIERLLNPVRAAYQAELTRVLRARAH